MLTLTDSKGRVAYVELDFGFDVEDTYIVGGVYDDDSEVTDEELDWMQHAHADKLAEEYFERAMARAESMEDR